MQLDPSTLKRSAVETLRTSQPKVLNVGLVFLLFTLVISYLSSAALGINYSMSYAEEYLNHFMNGNYDYAMSYLEAMAPPRSAYGIDLLLKLALSVVRAGFVIFLLNSVRKSGACYGNLLDGFGFAWKVVLLNILVAVVSVLWLLLFPVAHYRYSQAIYILVDDPSKSPTRCMRESARMMSGHKMELFTLDLSLIGWYIAAALPMIGYAVKVWSFPYVGTVKTHYYESLRLNAEQENAKNDFSFYTEI